MAFGQNPYPDFIVKITCGSVSYDIIDWNHPGNITNINIDYPN